MSIETSGAGNAIPELLLKTTPPRAPRHLLVRPRLGLADEQFRDRSLTVVQAPAGFGKTSLLAQWRREHMARGAAVAWISADNSQDPMRFLSSLILAVRYGCARPNFGRGLADGAISSLGELDGITAWLAEIAQMALEVVLVVDEAERLAPIRFESLSYLVHNAPSNLRLVVAARGGLDPIFADLAAYGQCASVGTEQLRFRLDETLNMVRGRFGNRVEANACARLHELTEGWPLGLQIALTAMERVADPRLVIDAMFDRGRGLREQLVAGLLAEFSAEESDFLIRLAVPDMLHPDLCVALTGRADAAELLARLVRETPIFVVADVGEWIRLHNLARDALRARFNLLPEAERNELHTRAMRWMVARGMIEHAAYHAHAAGQREAACQLAAQGLYDAVLRGQQATVFEWLDILTPEELGRFPRLRLAAAWALALSERHTEAGRLVADIQENSNVDPELRYECALILSGAAYYADQPDRCVAVFAPWIDAPPPKHPRLRQMHANRLSILALLEGDPAKARHYQHALPREDVDASQGYVARVGEFAVGLSYLWEGQPRLAEEVLRPALTRTDTELGRRHPLSSMLAALLAVTVYERDQLDEAAALLANRLDVLERAGMPETLLLGYRTAARIAAAQGMEHRALDLLEALHAIGVSRRLPRLCVVSFAEQVRLHASRSRAETCRALVELMDKALAGEALTDQPLLARAMELPRLMAHAWAAIAARDWTLASEVLTQAALTAEAMRLGRARIEIMGLRAIALERSHEDGGDLLREAWNLAQTYGLMRTLVDAHPLLADATQSIAEAGAGSRMVDALATARSIRPGGQRGTKPPRAVPCMVLTPKEREVLELLARTMSNKEIAQAMEVGEETVKWHIKNLFGKLDAGTRKHVVRRAQMLGLLEGGE